jgi:catechol 2,3-dioxygenase-like lactoylglutathione lyase family enzyme
MHLEHTALLVRDYDDAIDFFVGSLGFELVGRGLAVDDQRRPFETLGRRSAAGGGDRAAARSSRRKGGGGDAYAAIGVRTTGDRR